jgi:dihydroxyacetone kinase
VEPSTAATADTEVDRPVAGSPASRACAATAFQALERMSSAIVDAEEELGRIDAVAGDGDHGRGMVKGVTAAVSAARPVLDAGGGVKSLLTAAGDAWAAKAGGTSGALWGATLRGIGSRLGDESDEISPADVADAVKTGLAALQRMGKAQVGDKTMVDALVPFVETLERRVGEGADLAAAWADAAKVGTQAAQDTAGLRPRLGRARPLAERSVGTPDAGAVSLALCARTVADVLSTL